MKVADLESSLVDLKAQEQTAIATLRLRTKAEQGKVGSFRLFGRVSEIERQERES